MTVPLIRQDYLQQVDKIKNILTGTSPAPDRIPGYEEVVTEDEQLDQTPLSERILMALSRMRQAEHRSREGVDMSIYFRTEGEVCYACLGGWGLVGRLSLNPEWMKERDTRDIAMYRDVSFWTLGCYQVSLDRAKDGNVYEAFVMMGLNPIDGLKYNCSITHYHTNARAFYQDMHQLADRLKRDGY